MATTARPAWTRQLCSLAGTAFWVVAAFLAGVAALYVATASVATWGGAPVWPVVVGVAGMLAVCAVAFTLGALFPGRFTAPIVAVGITIVMLLAFRQAVGDNGGSSGAIGVLSPDGSVPGNDWGLFYPVSAGVPIVQAMFMPGVTLAAIGVLGLSPRTGGVGWRGALFAVAAGGARLRTVAVSLFTVGVALAVAGFVLAETANVSDPTSTLQIPAIDAALSGSSTIPYTPVCPADPGSFNVCVHPAFRSYLPQLTAVLAPAVTALSGLPAAPVRATEVPLSALPPRSSKAMAMGRWPTGSISSPCPMRSPWLLTLATSRTASSRTSCAVIREPLAIVLRAGNAGSNTAADHIEAARLAVAQLRGTCGAGSCSGRTPAAARTSSSSGRPRSPGGCTTPSA